MNLSNLEFREMRVADLTRVLEIEKAAQISPWRIESFEESLISRYECRVLPDKHELLAFYVVAAVMDELHILNLAVEPRVQGQGLGHALMHSILNLAKTRQLTKIYLEVRASNLTAQSLYQKWQFQQLAVRKNYYRSPVNLKEDALVFVRSSV